jgi:hypothetical protein
MRFWVWLIATNIATLESAVDKGESLSSADMDEPDTGKAV